jgi:hypothetical protein
MRSGGNENFRDEIRESLLNSRGHAAIAEESKKIAREEIFGAAGASKRSKS